MSHQHADDAPKFVVTLSRYGLVVATVSFLVAFIGGFFGLAEPLAAWLYGISLLSGGLPVAISAVSSLWHKKISINLLVTVAALGAAYLGQLGEAAAVMLFFTLAEAFEAYGEQRSKRAIQALMESAPKKARLESGELVPVEDVSPGQIIEVRPGDTIALDGVVVRGESAVDEATITGESLPKEKRKGSDVFAGTQNENGALFVKVTKAAQDSTLQKIVTLIKQAQEERPKAQAFLDKFAGYYIPVAIGLALLVAIVPPLLFGQPFEPWLTRALIFLVLACPDALVVSAPVAVAAAIGGASRHGALVKGGLVLERLSKISAVAFDKTKTLTVGKPTVARVTPFHGASLETVLADAAGVEKYSSHPLADAIREYAKTQGIAAHNVEAFKNVPGGGAVANCLVCDTREHAIGNLRHIKASAEICDEVLAEIAIHEREGMTSVLVAEGPKVIGVIGITDALRPESKGVIAELHRLGIKSAMLTGDNSASATSVAAQVGIDDINAELLPDDKSRIIGELQQKYGSVAMVGDGVNDAPSLAKADVGIAMGGSGSDVAIETADVSLMSDRIETIPYLVGLSKQAFAVIRQNVYGSLIIKGIILLLGVLGLIQLNVAVAIDAITAVLVVLNGLRLFSVKFHIQAGE